MTTLEQDKDRARINGVKARPSPAVLAHTARACPNRPGAIEHAPKTRLRHDHLLRSPWDGHSLSLPGRRPSGSKEGSAPVTETLLPPPPISGGLPPEHSLPTTPENQGAADYKNPISPYLYTGRSSAATPPRLCGAGRGGTARFLPHRPPPRMRRGTARRRATRFGSRSCALPGPSASRPHT